MTELSDVSLRAELTGGLAGLDAEAWDALSDPNDPFTEYAFLAALEQTGCVGADTGWRPVHAIVRDAAGRMVGAAPAYLKSHSYGEYIFDWSWADACQRSGIRYFPKLTCAVPFTPATGPRLRVAPDVDAEAVRRALAGTLRAAAERLDASGAHVLFAREDELDALRADGWAIRTTHQYHWLDRGFGDFDGWLAALTARRRKEVRRERKQAASAGLTLAVERARDLSLADVDALYRCYVATYEDKWGSPYLTEAFFHELPTRLGHRAIVATARQDGALVAGALAFTKGQHLYGRSWGTLVDVPSLHFELCYYAFIAWSLANGVTRFEAGAQGEHKIARGFLPARTWSAHHLRHPGLAAAVARAVRAEADEVARVIDQLSAHSPYRDDAAPTGAR